MMANILVVSTAKSFILTSLENQLKEQEYQIMQAGNDPSEIERIKEKMQAVLIYAEENSVIEMKMLVYLKDRAIEEEIPFFILGDSDQIAAVEAVIPKQFIKKQFLRPINVKEVAAAIDEYFKYDAIHPKKKILVVDDSGAMLRNVKGWLEDKYQVILANSGTMAIKYLAMNSPDLVLLDYEMPVCDGRQVLEMIRSESEFADVPVIFLTSKNDRESVMKVTALKPEGYLLKTMEPAQIVHEIDAFFEKQKWKM